MSRLRRLAVAALLAAAGAALAQEQGRPIDWRQQWTPSPAPVPGWTGGIEGNGGHWGSTRRGSHRERESSPVLRDVPSPLGERIDYRPFTPFYEVMIILTPGLAPCPPPYAAQACPPMR